MKQNDFEFQKLAQHEDIRGTFTKIYDSKNLIKLKNISEVFFTKSKKGTLRGMHFQREPFEINRIITCLSGEIIDVIVNIDPASKNYKRVFSHTLKKNESVFVPKNYAHGFYALTDCELLYLTDNLYSDEFEDGVMWNSIEFDWPNLNPIVSKRDQNFQKI